MSNELDEFGELFIKNVRDEAIFKMKALLSGTLKGESARILYPQISALGHKETLEEFGMFVVNEVVHDVLWYFEESEDYRLIGPSGSSLADESDGLPGELYTEDGWIARFSDDKRGM